MPTSFNEVIQKIHIDFFEFPLNKCDERTFYISIALRYQEEKAVCDLIYLLDRPKVFGAISLNEKYDHARNFFMKQFNYNLFYSDELLLAEKFSQTTFFKKSIKEFSKLYPKYSQKINFI